MAKNRLSKILARAGVASRRASETLIFAGKVKVNGETILVPQMQVDEKDDIRVDDQRIHLQKEKVYFVLNKPVGYICSSKKYGKQKIVIDLFSEVKARLFTVGRLDRDTKGLLIVTNDGHFSNLVIHPSSSIQKEYLVKTTEDLTSDHLMAISQGTKVEGVFVKPLKVSKVRNGTLKIVISEGKKREVRSLLENAGLKVLELMRIRIGALSLGALEPGQYREMTEREKELIFE